MKVGTCHARSNFCADWPSHSGNLKKNVKTKIHVSLRKVYRFHLNLAHLKK